MYLKEINHLERKLIFVAMWNEKGEYLNTRFSKNIFG
jgi:hypothetical protein